ncbi:MAG: hypothetical protein NVS1B6_01310 [Steroidobacteraceae bacterium]
MVARRWRAADAEVKVARDLDPSDAGITQAAASLSNTMGRFYEILEGVFFAGHLRLPAVST